MNETNESSDSGQEAEENGPRQKSRRPVVLIALSVLVAVFYFGAWQFQLALSDSVFHFDFAIVNLITAALIMLLILGWAFWLFFRSGQAALLSRVLPILLLVGLVAFPVCFRPVVKGDMGISRWQPRFWSYRTLDKLNADGSAATEESRNSDFGQFLGNSRNGIVDGNIAKLTKPTDLEELWKIDIGNGWSGISTRGDYLFTMEQRGSDETVSCYSVVTGESVWSTKVTRRHDEAVGFVGPRSTPCLDGDFVYTCGANGILQCLDIHNGDLVWRKDLCEILNIELKESVNSQGHSVQIENTKVIWGRASSPLIVDDLVIIPGGGPLDGKQVSLLAFNKTTGEEVWRAGDIGISYSSPTLMTVAGVRQVVSVNDNNVTGHRVDDGQILWQFPWPGNSNADANTSQPCLYGDSNILLSKGYGTGAELIEITKDEAGSLSAKSVWKNRRVLKTKLTSSIISGDNAYAISDTILECIDLKTGKRVWKRGRYGHGQLLIVGDKLVVHDEDGELHFIEKTADAFREIGEPIETIDGISWNYFAVTDRHIIVRSDLQMACFGIRNNE